MRTQIGMTTSRLRLTVKETNPLSKPKSLNNKFKSEYFVTTRNECMSKKPKMIQKPKFELKLSNRFNAFHMDDDSEMNLMNNNFEVQGKEELLVKGKALTKKSVSEDEIKKPLNIKNKPFKES